MILSSLIFLSDSLYFPSEIKKNSEKLKLWGENFNISENNRISVKTGRGSNYVWY